MFAYLSRYVRHNLLALYPMYAASKQGCRKIYCNGRHEPDINGRFTLIRGYKKSIPEEIISP